MLGILLCGNFVRGAAIVRDGLLDCRMRAVFRGARNEQIQNRHADRDSVRDLLENAGLRSISNFRCDFNSAIHRAGVKNDGAGLRKTQSLGVKLVTQDVVVCGKRRFVHAFCLHTEHDDYVRARKSLFNPVHATNWRARRDFFELAGNPHGRAAKCKAAAELAEQMNVRAREAAVPKLMRVRVEFSKNASAMVFPRSVASFFSGWRWISWKGLLWSRRNLSSSAVSGSRARRSRKR